MDNTTMEEVTCNIYDVCNIFPMFQCIVSYLKTHDVLNLIESSFLKQLKLQNGDSNVYDEYMERLIRGPQQLLALYRRYRQEFPRSTPIVCACQHGRMDDVELFMNLHPFHKYITNCDVNGYRDDMTLKEYVNQVGKSSRGYKYTPLIIAAKNEHFHVVKYLIEQGEADPNIANRSDGWNALHFAAWYNRTNTELIELLLTHMTLDNINKRSWVGYTPLDCAYEYNGSPICQEIIALLHSKGGKANCYDENGTFVGW
eukprot:g4547.t1